MAQQSRGHLGAAPPEQRWQGLGAKPPEIILKSLNTGLTSDHIKAGNPHAYTFTKALLLDLQEVFQQQQAHGLFLCEMGSQRPNESIDTAFKNRVEQYARGGHAGRARGVGFVDGTEALEDYIQEALKACKLDHLQIHSLPPYAYIGGRRTLSVSPPKFFNPLPGNTDRRAVRYDVVFLPTGEQFPVICCHSPSSGRWGRLTPARKKTVFDNCLQQAGVRHGAPPPMWMLCGDLNTKAGSLLTWKTAFEKDGDTICIHQALANNNKDGDYMLSQGFSTSHVESTIGASDRSRKHASDSHDMLTLRGVSTRCQGNTLPSSSKRDAPPLAVPAASSTGQCTSVSSSSRSFQWLPTQTGRWLKPAHHSSSERDAPPLAVPPTLATVQNTSVLIAAETQPEVDNEYTSDAQPLARSTHGLPPTTVQEEPIAASLLETLSNIAESDHNADAADTLLQELHGYPHEVRSLRDLAEVTEKLLGLRQRIAPLVDLLDLRHPAKLASQKSMRSQSQAWSPTKLVIQ